MRHRLSASRIALGSWCLYWAHPRVRCVPLEDTSDARKGTTFHKGAHLRGLGMRGPIDMRGHSDLERESLSNMLEQWRRWFESMGFGDEVDGNCRFGTGCRIDWARFETQFYVTDEGKVGRSDAQNRDYSAIPDNAIPGTVDLIFKIGHTVYVIDYKSGFLDHSLADHWDQLAHLGMCAFYTHKSMCDRVVVGVLWVGDDDVRIELKELDMVDIQTHAAQVRAQLAEIDIDRRVPTAHAGDHCDRYYCPAIGDCPETRRMLNTAEVPVGRVRLPIVGQIESEEHALATLAAFPHLEAWMTRRKAEVASFADLRGGIKRGDGMVFKTWERTTETPMLQAGDAMEGLRMVFGADAEDAVEIKRHVTFESIERVARARKEESERTTGKKITIKGQVMAARDALRAAGALKISKWKAAMWGKPEEE